MNRTPVSFWTASSETTRPRSRATTTGHGLRLLSMSDRRTTLRKRRARSQVTGIMGHFLSDGLG
jgi:hypothetical protein